MPNNTFRAQRKLLKSGDDSTNDRGDRVRAKRTRKLKQRYLCGFHIQYCHQHWDKSVQKKRKEVLLELGNSTVHSDSKTPGFAVSPVNCKLHRLASILCAACKLSKIEAPNWCLFIQNQLRTMSAGFYLERLFPLNMILSLQAVCEVCCSQMQVFYST